MFSSAAECLATSFRSLLFKRTFPSPARAMSKLLRIDKDEKSTSDALQSASKVLRSGGVVGLPTDTLYGIACTIDSNEGICRLYEIKRRQGHKPVAICVSSVEEFHKLAEVTVEDSILKDLFPGPVTTIFKRQDSLNPALNPKTDLVGIRIPDYQPIVRLVQLCGQPLALTSANISSEMSSLQTDDFRELWPSLDMVLDGGVITPASGAEDRRGSTVIDLSIAGQFHIVREGVRASEIKSLLIDKAHLKCIEQ